MAFEDPKFPVTDPAPGMSTVYGNLNATDLATITLATAGSAAWCFKGGKMAVFIFVAFSCEDVIVFAFLWTKAYVELDTRASAFCVDHTFHPAFLPYSLSRHSTNCLKTSCSAVSFSFFSLLCFFLVACSPTRTPAVGRACDTKNNRPTTANNTHEPKRKQSRESAARTRSWEARWDCLGACYWPARARSDGSRGRGSKIELVQTVGDFFYFYFFVRKEPGKNDNSRRGPRNQLAGGRGGCVEERERGREQRTDEQMKIRACFRDAMRRSQDASAPEILLLFFYRSYRSLLCPASQLSTVSCVLYCCISCDNQCSMCVVQVVVLVTTSRLHVGDRWEGGGAGRRKLRQDDSDCG